MKIKKIMAAQVAAVLLTSILGAACSASPSREQIEAEDAQLRARGIAVEYYTDEDYAMGRVPYDAADRVIEPDDGFSSDN